MRLHTRFGLSICATVFLIVSIILLLPTSRITPQLQNIPFGNTLENYRNGFWSGWGPLGEDEYEDGFRLVVFGDSWVDDSIDDTAAGKGVNWVDVLCEELNCTSQANFAATQPSKAFPAAPPTGAIASNGVYLSALNNTLKLGRPAADMLPDFASQIMEYLNLPISSKPKATIFVVCFGFWDIYHFASLDYKEGQNATAQAINEIFNHLDILYEKYAKDILTPYIESKAADNKNSTDAVDHTFRVVLPKLIDPTLLPGWIAQRPIPLQPSSVAEEQKNAVYLTNHWNILLERRMKHWVEATPEITDETTKLWEKYDPQGSPLQKHVFFYDLPRYLVDVILEQQMEKVGVSDASGIGKGESPFDNVRQGCVGVENGMMEMNGMGVCKEPDDYLFWDGFSLGAVANEAVGKAVGSLVKEGMMRAKNEGVKQSGWFGEG